MHENIWRCIRWLRSRNQVDQDKTFLLKWILQLYFSYLYDVIILAADKKKKTSKTDDEDSAKIIKNANEDYPFKETMQKEAGMK